TYRPSCEYTGFVTRQLTGDAAVPSRRFVSTVSMTVPSRTGCSGPAELIGAVTIGRAGGEVDDATGALLGAPNCEGTGADAPTCVARTTAWATSSIVGGGGRLPAVDPARPRLS